MLTGLPPYYSQNINIMYQKILNGELRFPDFVSSDAQDLIEGLLIRDPAKRLGSDFEVIKNHSFFKSIDWDKLYRKEIVPPFKPPVLSKDDTTQIDPMFLSEKAVDSLVETAPLSTEATFLDFTFVGDSALA